ncbi:MAG: matrixin family metalloprotease [Luteitalea sp.]|nr:matrixin family metalloprotease [Luteitalea sp.]
MRGARGEGRGAREVQGSKSKRGDRCSANVSAALVKALLLVVLLASPTFAYLKLGVHIGDQTIALRWQELPVRYFVSDQGVPGVTPTDLDGAVQRAARAWEDVPTASITFARAGFTASLPGEEDGMSTLGFEDRPELERVLGATSITVDTVTGEILEADIFFNAAFPWTTASGGEPGRFDLESIALHELGHLTGLSHSALGETELVHGGGRRVLGAGAVMFPIAFSPGNIDGRRPMADDIAGLSDLYPAGDFRRRTGSVSGRITKDGRGVFGAHVTAFNLRTRQLVGNFSLSDDGGFVIAGVDAGPCLLRVEPLDDGDLDSFFDETDRVDVDFLAAVHTKLANVQAGSDTGEIRISVRAR